MITLITSTPTLEQMCKFIKKLNDSGKYEANFKGTGKDVKVEIKETTFTIINTRR